MDIQELRKQIDQVDTELVQLFCRRMDLAARIAAYKKENQLPIHHPGREQEVLNRVAGLAGPELEPYTAALYTKLFELSREYQMAQIQKD